METLTIITATLNSENTINKTLDSVRNLKLFYNNIEYIIVDGYSNDNTVQLVEASGIADKVLMRKRGGVYDAMQFGINNSRGEFVWILNSDDYLSEDSVEYLKLAYDRMDRVDVFHSNIIFSDSEGKSQRLFRSSIWRLILVGMNYYHPTMIVRRELYNKYPLNRDMRLSSLADYGFIFEVLFRSNAKIHHFDLYPVVFELGGVSSKLSLKDSMFQNFLVRREHLGIFMASISILITFALRVIRKVTLCANKIF
jgi:glycosyltransferase involved in cell wall biosynthesis